MKAFAEYGMLDVDLQDWFIYMSITNSSAFCFLHFLVSFVSMLCRIARY